MELTISGPRFIVAGAESVWWRSAGANPEFTARLLQFFCASYDGEETAGDRAPPVAVRMRKVNAAEADRPGPCVSASERVFDRRVRLSASPTLWAERAQWS